MSEAFLVGNKVRINSKKLVVNGCTATIIRWHHDDVYTVVLLDGGIFCGRSVTVRAEELEKIS